MKKLLALIGVNSDKALGGLGSKVRIPHVAFSIAIKGLSSDPSSYSKRFTEFAENLQKGPAIDIGNLADKISGAVDIDLSRVAILRMRRDKAQSVSPLRKPLQAF